MTVIRLTIQMKNMNRNYEIKHIIKLHSVKKKETFYCVTAANDVHRYCLKFKEANIYSNRINLIKNLNYIR